MLSSSLLVAGAFCGPPLVGVLQQSRVAAKFPCGRLTVPPGMTMMDLKGKTAFVAGVADSSGYGWAICKALAEAGATVTVGTWPPVLGIFEKSLRSGMLLQDRRKC